MHGFHHRLHLFAKLLVGNTENCDVCNFTVGYQQILNLLGIDVYPTADDHETLAVRQVEKTVLVHIADIARGRPTLVIVGAGSFTRLIVILKTHRLTTKIDSANFTYWQFVTIIVDNMQLSHQCRTHRPLVRQPVGGVDNGDTDAFAGRVVFDDNLAPPRDHFFLDLNRARCGGVYSKQHGTDVVALAHFIGQLEHADEHNWHPLAVSYPVLFNKL